MKASTKGYRHGYLKDWYGRSQVGGRVRLAVFLFLYTQFANGYVLTVGEKFMTDLSN